MGNFNSLFGATHTEETVAPAVEPVVAPAVTEPVVEQQIDETKAAEVAKTDNKETNDTKNWNKKTPNVKVTEGKNLYDGSKKAWSGTYEE